MLQVLAISEGAEALGAEVLRADNRVLLGLEVAPANVQHPLLQQLRAAEREPEGRRMDVRVAAKQNSALRVEGWLHHPSILLGSL